MATAFDFVRGVVSATLPFSGSVMVTVGLDERAAIVGSAMGFTGNGARECAGLQPGTPVICLFATGGNRTENYVIAALPLIKGDTTAAPLEMLEIGGGSTAFTEPLLHRFIFDKNQRFSFIGGGMPADIAPGEWAMLNDLGGGIAVERFSSWLRASEFCGVSADAVTETLRISGRERIDHSLTAEARDAIDAGVPSRASFRALYSTEAFGMSGPNAADAEVKAFSAEAIVPAVGLTPGDPTLMAFKPKAARMAARVIDLESSAVGGQQRSVVAPQFVGETASGTSETLLREHRFSDGGYLVESMRGVHIRKSGIIPAVPISAPEQPLTAVPPTDPFTLTDDVLVDLGYAVLAYELHAFMANVASGCPPAQRGNPAEFPAWKKQWLKPGDTIDVQTYPGKKPTKFYGTSAGIDIMPDGSVVITDGWGSQIIMAGGNVIITAPGDIYRLPGRSDVVLSPGDVIIRAKKDVDISSAARDVRVKAERNVSVLGGNGLTGGVLIESAGTNSAPKTDTGANEVNAGVVIKSATHALISAYGDAEVRSLYSTVALTTLGNILLTADRQIVANTKALYIDTRELKKGSDPATGKEAVFVFTLGAVVLPATVLAAGVSATGSVLGGQSHDNKDTKAFLASSASLSASIITAYDDGIGKTFSETVLESYAFSFRLDAEYDGKDAAGAFTLPAAVWQVRMGSGAGWIEPTVGKDKTAPYPGRESWEKGGLVIVEPIYYDPSKGYLPYTPSGDGTPPAVAKRVVPLTKYIAPS